MDIETIIGLSVFLGYLLGVGLSLLIFYLFRL